MKKPIAHLNLSWSCMVISLISLSFTIGPTMMIFSPNAEPTSQLIQTSQFAVLDHNQQVFSSPTMLPSPTPSGSSNSSGNGQNQDLISQAQNDISVANTIISWSGFFLALIATTVTVATFFGIRELRRIQQVRKEFEEHVQEVTSLKNRIEEELATLVKR